MHSDLISREVDEKQITIQGAKWSTCKMPVYFGETLIEKIQVYQRGGSLEY